MTTPVREILFLAQRVPYPPDRGDRITTWHLLRHFIAQGHRVRIGCFLEAPADEDAVAELRARGCEVLTARHRAKLWLLPGLFTGRPLTVLHFSARGLLRRIRESGAERAIDLCYAYSSSMGFWMMELAAGRDDDGPLSRSRKIAHFAELDSDKWAQYATSQRFPASWVYRREARLLLERERRLARFADVNVVCSPAEKALFEQRIPEAPAVVLPNGVDLETFRPGAANEPHTVVFTGVMNYLPNVDAVLWFAESCWPDIRHRFPAARFLVVGSGPTREVQRLNGRHGIVVTGRVPSTVPWMQQASVAVAPLRIARGIQNKVLEAMACGLPTIVSPKACTGIDAVDGEHLLVAADGESTVRAVRRLFEDPPLAASIGRAARRRMEERYEWSRILAGLDTWVWG